MTFPGLLPGLYGVQKYKKIDYFELNIGTEGENYDPVCYKQGTISKKKLTITT